MNFMETFLGACLVLAATALGAAGILAFRKIERRYFVLMVAFSAGVMGFSALEMILGAYALTGSAPALSSFLIGLLCFFLLDSLMPHAHMILTGNPLQSARRKVALLVGTITLHNIPEGLAVASAFAESSSLGWLVTLTIALQDIPEGLIVSAPALCYGVTTRRSFGWGVLSGVVEFLAALGGFLFLSAVANATPWALGFSSGAMTYVVLAELLPDILRAGNRQTALALFLVGLAAGAGFAALLS